MKDYSKLTLRELEVLRLISKGLDNYEIAETLVVAICTIKTFINRIYCKLGLSSTSSHAMRVRAALYYLENKAKLEQ